MDWRLVEEEQPHLNESVLMSVKDLSSGKSFVVPGEYKEVIDPETGEFINSFTMDYWNQEIRADETNNMRVTAWMPMPEPYVKPFRVIVTGSPSFNDYALMCRKLDKIFTGHWPTAILCGESEGVYLLSRRYAREKEINTEFYYGDWETYGEKAIRLRNETMVKNAEALVAFWDGKSAETKHIIEIAREGGLQVRVINI